LNLNHAKKVVRVVLKAILNLNHAKKVMRVVLKTISKSKQY